MSDFKAKMHQIRFRLGLRPRPRWGAYSAPPDPLAGFKGPTSKGREEKGGRGGEVREGEGREKDGRGGEGKWRDLLIRGGRRGEKGRGRVPPVITFSPGPRGARIVTGHAEKKNYLVRTR